MAVYTVKYLLQVVALLQYCEVVRDIANKSGNWRYYDQQFRYLRQTNPEKFPWDRVMWELWNQARIILHRRIHGIKNPKPGHFCPFQKVCAGNFTPANSVPAVDSSTRVLSAVPRIPQLSVMPSPVSSMHPQVERTKIGSAPLKLRSNSSKAAQAGTAP